MDLDAVTVAVMRVMWIPRRATVLRCIVVASHETVHRKELICFILPCFLPSLERPQLAGGKMESFTTPSRRCVRY